MNKDFERLINKLDPKLICLLEMTPVSPANLPKTMPKEGIYLFSEKGNHLYVGRSRNIRRRIQKHSRPGATHHTASFAFLIAREDTGWNKAAYKPEGSRAQLAEIPEFANAFTKAKERIRSMDLRFVEETDSLSQALLEIYVAISLRTPYNDFRTH
jgi:hypothetical protein